MGKKPKAKKKKQEEIQHVGKKTEGWNFFMYLIFMGVFNL
jgi:hypothetical protein